MQHCAQLQASRWLRKRDVGGGCITSAGTVIRWQREQALTIRASAGSWGPMVAGIFTVCRRSRQRPCSIFGRQLAQRTCKQRQSFDYGLPLSHSTAASNPSLHPVRARLLMCRCVLVCRQGQQMIEGNSGLNSGYLRHRPLLRLESESDFYFSSLGHKKI